MGGSMSKLVFRWVPSFAVDEGFCFLVEFAGFPLEFIWESSRNLLNLPGRLLGLPISLQSLPGSFLNSDLQGLVCKKFNSGLGRRLRPAEAWIV